jgi:hypothetical protein
MKQPFISFFHTLNDLLPKTKKKHSQLCFNFKKKLWMFFQPDLYKDKGHNIKVENILKYLGSME